MLTIKNLQVSVEDKEILRGIDLQVKPGEVHAIMGPNRASKSTLAHVLAGREGYEVTEGEVLYRGKNLLELEPEERACEGVFLAFQYPEEIPGVTIDRQCGSSQQAAHFAAQAVIAIENARRSSGVSSESAIPSRTNV